VHIVYWSGLANRSSIVTDVPALTDRADEDRQGLVGPSCPKPLEVRLGVLDFGITVEV
jgi:hypothetical protein